MKNSEEAHAILLTEFFIIAAEPLIFGIKANVLTFLF